MVEALQVEPARALRWDSSWFGGAWIVSSYDDAKLVLSSQKFSAQRLAGWVNEEADRTTHPTSPSQANQSGKLRFKFLQDILSKALIFTDQPDHGRLRGLMRHHFTPSGLNGLQAWIEQRCGQLLDDAVAQNNGTFDFIEAVARPLPTAVIAKILGISELDGQFWHASSSDLAAWLESVQANAQLSARAQRAMVSFVRVVERALAVPSSGHDARDGLLFDLQRAQASGEIKDQTELLAQACMLLFAGLETTRHFLGTLVWQILQDQHSWHQLLQMDADGQREPVKKWVKEVMRLYPPIRYTGRRVAVTHEWRGSLLKRGQAVVVRLDDANRDATRYEDAHALAPNGQRSANMAFGSGPHVCIGAALTLLEAEICVLHMLKKWPGVRLAPHHPAPEWLNSPLYVGLNALTLSFK